MHEPQSRCRGRTLDDFCWLFEGIKTKRGGAGPVFRAEHNGTILGKSNYGRSPTSKRSKGAISISYIKETGGGHLCSHEVIDRPMLRSDSSLTRVTIESVVEHMHFVAC